MLVTKVFGILHGCSGKVPFFYYCLVLTKFECFLTEFDKNPQCKNCMIGHASGTKFHVDRQTDRTKLIVANCNVVNLVVQPHHQINHPNVF